jgi:hypothetical protein
MSAEPAAEATRPAREDLLDRVRADPSLGPRERETTFTFATDEAIAHVHTEEAAIIRRLLSHDDVEVDALGVLAGDRRRTLTLAETLAETDSESLVVRLKGRLPLRYLTVATVGRNHDEHAAVVSEEVFGE